MQITRSSLATGTGPVHGPISPGPMTTVTSFMSDPLAVDDQPSDGAGRANDQHWYGTTGHGFSLLLADVTSSIARSALRVRG